MRSAASFAMSCGPAATCDSRIAEWTRCSTWSTMATEVSAYGYWSRENHMTNNTRAGIDPASVDRVRKTTRGVRLRMAFILLHERETAALLGISETHTHAVLLPAAWLESGGLRPASRFPVAHLTHRNRWGERR
jgi:hypothetical protein